MVKSNENKAVIDGKGASEVEFVNKNGELKIRMPLSKILKGDDISVTLYYKNIEAVEANEGSRIACSDEIKTVAFDIKVKEGSEVVVPRKPFKKKPVKEKSQGQGNLNTILQSTIASLTASLTLYLLLKRSFE